MPSPESRYLASLPARSSRERMSRALRTLARLHVGHRGAEVEWAALSRSDVLAIVRRLDGRAATTQRVLVAALRGVLREAGVEWPVYSAARAPRGVQAPVGVALDDQQLTSLFDAARTDRDRALLGTLALGMRIGEVAALDVTDLDLGPVPTALVRGKGRRHRRVALGHEAALALATYVADRVAAPVFLSRSGAPASVRVLQHAFMRMVERAGLECTCHDLRRTAITRALLRGAPIEAVAVHVGHASVEQTRKYLRADPIEQSKLVVAVLSR